MSFPSESRMCDIPVVAAIYMHLITSLGWRISVWGPVCDSSVGRASWHRAAAWHTILYCTLTVTKSDYKALSTLPGHRPWIALSSSCTFNPHVRAVHGSKQIWERFVN